MIASFDLCLFIDKRLMSKVILSISCRQIEILCLTVLTKNDFLIVIRLTSSFLQVLFLLVASIDFKVFLKRVHLQSNFKFFPQFVHARSVVTINQIKRKSLHKCTLFLTSHTVHCSNERLTLQKKMSRASTSTKTASEHQISQDIAESFQLSKQIFFDRLNIQ